MARNPEPDSTLPLLLRVPLGDGLVFRTRGTWPREAALYCHPVPRSAWPDEPELVEQIPLRSCVRRGAAVDIVAQRGRESRSQIVYTRARGREMVFWQTPKTRKQARPDVSLPTARASGLVGLTIVVDAHERYAYRFAHQQVALEKRALRCGDYAVEIGGEVAAAVERKSLTDLLSSLTSGRLRFALAELAALPRAAVVVEDRYSQVFTSEHVRASVAADGLAELQVRYPNVPIVFCETRSLAEEWTYRYLAAAAAWTGAEEAALGRIEAVEQAPPPETPTTPEVPIASATPTGTAAGGPRRRWSAAGRWSRGSRCRTAGGCAPTSSRPGTARTRRAEHRPSASVRSSVPPSPPPGERPRRRDTARHQRHGRGRPVSSPRPGCGCRSRRCRARAGAVVAGDVDRVAAVQHRQHDSTASTASTASTSGTVSPTSSGEAEVHRWNSPTTAVEVSAARPSSSTLEPSTQPAAVRRTTA